MIFRIQNGDRAVHPESFRDEQRMHLFFSDNPAYPVNPVKKLSALCGLCKR
jgi:hypothetical protein